MTIDEKVELVRKNRKKYGLNRCCEALALSKGTWHYRIHKKDSVDEQEEYLKEVLRSLIIDNPGYGYRRLKPEVEARTGIRVNHKRLLRILREANLGLTRNVVKSEPSEVQRIIAENSGDLDVVNGHDWESLEVFSTDFTELRYAGGTKKAWLMATVDIVSKWAPGWAIGSSRNRVLARECWQKTCRSFDDLDVDTKKVIVHHDKDAVYTSYDWLRTILIDSSACISYSEMGAKGNPWVESMWGRIKTELGSLITEAQTLEELRNIIDRHMDYYNHKRRHSTINYRAPMTYLQNHIKEENAAPY